MEILLCKLVTGEEVMGEVITGNQSTMTIKNPVQVTVVKTVDGTPNVGFLPFPAYAPNIKNATIDFLHEHVVYCYTPSEEFCKNYEQVFGLGLVLPKEKQIITG